MKKLLRYKHGKEYITGGMVSIKPHGIEPIEEYDLEGLTDKEFTQFQKTPEDIKLRKKMKRIRKEKHG